MQLAPLLQNAEYHRGIGGTPPDILVRNPGKCRAELFDDQQLLDYLRTEYGGILKFYRDPKDNTERMFAERFLLDLRYLDSVKRLPKEFENYLK